MFEAALGRQQQQQRLGLGATVSIVLHAAVLLGVLFYRAAAPDKEAEKAPEVKFVAAAPPPPPPPPPPAGAVKPKTTVKPVKPKDLAPKIIPKEIPKEDPKPPEPQEAAGAPDVPGEPGGVAGGVPGGVPGGVVGGVVGGTGPVTAAPPKNVPSFVIDKERLSSPDPRLPDELATRYAGQSVSGKYRICIDTDGNVSAVSVVSPLNGADEQIMAHLKSTWKYKPQPVPICTVRNFVFNVK
jgi:periplasmic protein TonB